MARHRDASRFILDEIRQAVESVPDGDVERFIELMKGAKNVIVFGRGRSGFVGRGFTVRLVHIGIPAYVVGETVTPPVHEDDVVLLISGSGETFSVVVTGQTAKTLGSKIITITTQPGSTLAGIADLTIVLPTKSGAQQRELAPLGTIFEDACQVFLDGVVAELMDAKKATEESMRARHATLE